MQWEGGSSLSLKIDRFLPPDTNMQMCLLLILCNLPNYAPNKSFINHYIATFTFCWFEPFRRRCGFYTVNAKCKSMLTYRYGPDCSNLHHGFGSGVEAAVLNGVADGDVSIQGDSAEVHDGGRGEQDIQIDPDRAKGAG